MQWQDSLGIGVLVAEICATGAVRLSPNNLIIPWIMYGIGAVYVLGMICQWIREACSAQVKMSPLRQVEMSPPPATVVASKPACRQAGRQRWTTKTGSSVCVTSTESESFATSWTND